MRPRKISGEHLGGETGRRPPTLSAGAGGTPAAPATDAGLLQVRDRLRRALCRLVLSHELIELNS